MNVYRVEKDGMSFYVQPDQIANYEELGYTIYKQVEQVVPDAAAEVAATRAASGVVVGEVVVDG